MFDPIRYVWWLQFGPESELVEASRIAKRNGVSKYSAWWVLYGKR